MAEPDLQAVAERALPLLDLTSLNDGDSDATTRALCARAATPAGPVAAICIYPRFLAVARPLLDPRIRLATVADFPAGRGEPAAVAAEIRAAVAAGADEVDMVFPYAAFLAGERAAAQDAVAAGKAACGDRALLKVILESGRFPSDAALRAAADAAIAGGADFLKTSTGKTSPAATPEAARVLLAAIAAAGRPVGFKAAGGIRTAADAATYLALADAMLAPAWATPATFRFGASGLLDDLLGRLGVGSAAPAPAASY